MWILKNSNELLVHLESPTFSHVTSIKSFDFSTLNTTIPHLKLKYTWAPQTVHNTPVMHILKGYYYIITIFSIKLVKRALLNRCLMILETYSDSPRFFQYKIPPLFSTVFQKVDGRHRRYATVIQNLRLYQTIIDQCIVCQIIDDSILYMSDVMNSRFWEFGTKM